MLAQPAAIFSTSVRDTGVASAIVNIGNDSNLFDNISFETGSIDDFSVDINEQIIRQSEAAAESSVKKELEIRGLYLDFLEINMDISESDSIIITDISFTPNAVTPKDILKIAIYEITGCENIKEVEQ